MSYLNKMRENSSVVILQVDYSSVVEETKGPTPSPLALGGTVERK